MNICNIANRNKAIILKMQSKIKMTEEVLEEIRMTTGFDRHEIKRLNKKFYEITEDNESMSIADFFSISCIYVSPLKHRVASIFGFSDSVSHINAKQFIVGVSRFNCPLIESREEKMRVAFRLQDIDGDGVINKSDIVNYLNLVTGILKIDESGVARLETKLDTYDAEEIANKMLQESATDSLKQFITFNDFQRIISSSDFQTKLRLPI